MASMLPLLIIVVLFAVMVIVPGRRKARDAQSMRSTLAPGVDVVTTAGVYGRVDSIDTEQSTVDLEISDGVIVRFASQAVARVISTDPGAEGADGSDVGGDIGGDSDDFPADAQPDGDQHASGIGDASDTSTSTDPHSSDADRRADNGSNRGTDGISS